VFPRKLDQGPEGLDEIKEYLNKNKTEGYTLSIFNMLEGTTIEIVCNFDQMIDVIRYFALIEHDWPAWINKNNDTRSYIVAMNFTRGCIKTPATGVWTGMKLEIVA
jgi:hypothetical protein